MATTTNFGWETPDDTDLVKDGALAIRTLGSAIDTSLVDLKGGTTGQVLSKTSNTDMDFTWVAQDDSNAIQNAIVDAKGDLITATAADTPARLAVGTNGQVLTADSTTATGLKWAAASGGGATYANYTPTFTNVTTGNGTLNFSRYASIGKFVHFYGKWSLGSTSAITGQIGVSLPVTAASDLYFFVGRAVLGDAGTNDYTGVIMITGTDKIVLDAEKANATYTFKEATSSTIPFTWTNTDSFTWSVVYEAA